MAMESILEQLETRIEELVETYRGAAGRAAELETKVAELESQLEDLNAKLASTNDAGERVRELEAQRDELANRLEKVLGLIDGVLSEDRG